MLSLGCEEEEEVDDEGEAVLSPGHISQSQCKAALQGATGCPASPGSSFHSPKLYKSCLMLYCRRIAFLCKEIKCQCHSCEIYAELTLIQ